MERLVRLSAHVCGAERESATLEVAIVGAGFSGLLCAVSLLDRGVPLESIVILEAGEASGGVWRNGGVGNYPGAACDVTAYEYLPLLQRVGFVPSAKYVGQAEIGGYANKIVERFGLLPCIRFGTQVTSARYVGEDSAKPGLWELELQASGVGRSVSAQHVVMACGPLSAPQMPRIAGLGSFRGPSFHTAAWDHSAALRGKHVGVVGTGASAAQVITTICHEASHVTVFQRSPVWAMPRNDEPTPAKLKQKFASQAGFQDKLRDSNQKVSDAFAKSLHDPEENEKYQQQVRELIAQQVPNEQLRHQLTPQYPFWGKRVLYIDDYYSSFTRENVSLVADAGGVVRETERGLRVASGGEFQLDAIIYATGFDPLTVAIPLIGRGGKTLQDRWGKTLEQPRTLFGIHACGFPNLYFMIGPQAFNPIANVTILAEGQANYIADLVAHMRRDGLRACEPSAAAEEAWVARTEATVPGKVWTKCSNWYMKTGDNGKPFYGIWMDTHGEYLKASLGRGTEAYTELEFSR